MQDLINMSAFGVSGLKLTFVFFWVFWITSGWVLITKVLNLKNEGLLLKTHLSIGGGFVTSFFVTSILFWILHLVELTYNILTY